MGEKLWEFATEKELKEWEILKNEGAFECMNWLYVNGYLNTDKVIKEFEVYYDDGETALHCLKDKYKDSKQK
jgi:hypothetical protein